MSSAPARIPLYRLAYGPGQPSRLRASSRFSSSNSLFKASASIRPSGLYRRQRENHHFGASSTPLASLSPPILACHQVTKAIPTSASTAPVPPVSRCRSRWMPARSPWPRGERRDQIPSSATSNASQSQGATGSPGRLSPLPSPLARAVVVGSGATQPAHTSMVARIRATGGKVSGDTGELYCALAENSTAPRHRKALIFGSHMGKQQHIPY